MGQIIRLHLTSAEYPDDVAALDQAESVLLSAMRSWFADFRQREDPLPGLFRDMDAAGAHDAAFPVDQLMAVVVRSARRPVAIHDPHCGSLSDDEKHVLGAASLTQGGDRRMAERALRTTLLSTQGAELALGPMQALGELFAEAKLYFRRRQPVADGTVT